MVHGLETLKKLNGKATGKENGNGNTSRLISRAYEAGAASPADVRRLVNAPWDRSQWTEGQRKVHDDFKGKKGKVEGPRT